MKHEILLQVLGTDHSDGMYILFEGVQHEELFQHFGLTSFPNFTSEEHLVYYGIHLKTL